LLFGAANDLPDLCRPNAASVRRQRQLQALPDVQLYRAGSDRAGDTIMPYISTADDFTEPQRKLYFWLSEMAKADGNDEAEANDIAFQWTLSFLIQSQRSAAKKKRKLKA
jgi:hypothetical protein